MGKERIIVAMDIGTSKITTLVGDIDNVDNLYIVGFGESKTKGIEKGVIVKSNDVIRSIKESIDMAESTTGSKISSVIANIGGYHLECRNDVEELSFENPKKTITTADIGELTAKATSNLSDEEHHIIHVIPKKYILDEEYGVIDPVGLYGSKLRGEFHIVLSKTNSYMNLKRVIEAAGIRVLDFIANPIASSTAVLYPEEKDLGVAVLDIGAGTTDLAVYRDGSIEYIKAFPIGGNQITMDIAHRFKLSKEEAEDLKINYGMAMVDYTPDETIEIHPRGSEEPVYISQRELADTIEARLSEIFEIVMEELEEMGFLTKISGGIVLTGGVANTIYIQELAKVVFQTDVRIGKPKDFKGFADKIAFPQYSTVLGMLLFKKNSISVEQIPQKESDISIFEFGKSLIEKIKNLF